MENKTKWILALFIIHLSSAIVTANPICLNEREGINRLEEKGLMSPPPPSLHFCVGQSINFLIDDVEGVVPITYQWYKNGVSLTDSVSKTLSINFADLTHSGNYYCLITDGNGCTQKSNEVNIDVTDNPVITVTGDTAAFLGETVALTAEGATTYHWTDLTIPISTITPLTSNNSIVNVTAPATGDFDYEVIGTNGVGCSGRDTFSLHIEDCGSSVADNDGNLYQTKAYNHVCWFLENFKGTTYPDGSSIETALIYEISQLSSAQILATYGRLYDWASATNDNSYGTPTLPIQGVCPTGWELPLTVDYENLLLVPSVNTTYDLRSTNYWIDNNGRNLVDFNIVPAGYYNAGNQRFENIFGVAYFITADCYTDSHTLNITTCRHDCPDYYMDILNIHNAFSVRCVKKLP